MNIQQRIPLSDIEEYKEEKYFSAALAKNLKFLNVGSFEKPETESNVGTRRADIVAVGEDGRLVVENQFRKADWHHWGRLEAYARSKEADVAVLVAEEFEELMIATCRLRNEESPIDWYLIQVQVNSHKELSFHHVVGPTIDIQPERKAEAAESEFWAPIHNGKFGELFLGARIWTDSWMVKPIRRGMSIDVWLHLTRKECDVQLHFNGKNPSERRDKVMTLFPKSDYTYENTDTPKQIKVTFPVLDKGKNDRDDWDEIREALVTRGTDIYNKIIES